MARRVQSRRRSGRNYVHIVSAATVVIQQAYLRFHPIACIKRQLEESLMHTQTHICGGKCVPPNMRPSSWHSAQTRVTVKPTDLFAFKPINLQ